MKPSGENKSRDIGQVRTSEPLSDHMDTELDGLAAIFDARRKTAPEPVKNEKTHTTSGQNGEETE